MFDCNVQLDLQYTVVARAGCMRTAVTYVVKTLLDLQSVKLLLRMYCMYEPRVPNECCILGSVKAILPILPLSPARIQICVWGWHSTYCSGCCDVTCPTNMILPVSHGYVAVMSNSRHVQLRVYVGAFIYVKYPLLICVAVTAVCTYVCMYVCMCVCIICTVVSSTYYSEWMEERC